jgi:hypothetical protein
MKPLSALFFSALTIAIIAWILWTSLDFQDCIKSYGQNDPSAEHLKKGIPALVGSFPSYRHCVGAYVTDKNAVITAICTLVIAVFTTVLGIFTMSLASSTRIAADAAQSSAETAQKALLIANRPVITVGELELIESDAVLNKPVISWALRNSGTGSGVVTGIKVEVVMQGDNTPRIFSRQSSAWRGTIEVGKTSTGHQVTTPTMQVRIKEILAGRLLLYLAVYLEVMDIMENRGTAVFPFIFDSQAKTFKFIDQLNIGDENDDPQA